MLELTDTVEPPVDEAAAAEAARMRASVVRPQPNFFDQFDSDPDAGEVSLEERMRLSAKDGYYRGTIVGSAELRRLVQAGQDSGWPDDIKQQYESIVADLTRHDLLRPPNTAAEAAAVLAGQTMVGAPHAAAEAGHSPPTPDERQTPYVAELFARNAPTLGTPQEPQWPRPALPDSQFERAAMTTQQRNRYSTPARDTLPIAEMMMNVLTNLATLPRRSFESAARYNATGEYDPAPIVEAAGLVTGLPLGRGGLGAGARMPPGGLPTDTASRMARADKMGMRRDMDLYHGTGITFDEFKAVPTTADGWVLPGVSLARDPAIANEFALAPSQGNAQANPQVHKVWHRAEKPTSLTLTGNESHSAVVATLREAFESGYDAVMLKNYTSPGGIRGDMLVVRDGSNCVPPMHNSTQKSATAASCWPAWREPPWFRPRYSARLRTNPDATKAAAPSHNRPGQFGEQEALTLGPSSIGRSLTAARKFTAFDLA
jgi:hypothetical protein